MASTTTDSSAPADNKIQLLSISYSSPNSTPFAQVYKLPAPATSMPQDRTAYLAALRQATAEAQERVNKELTARMEEDKEREGVVSAGGMKKVDEDKEEDNYGEEVVEEG